MKTDSESLKQLTDIFQSRGGIDLHIYEDQFHRTDLYFDGKGNRFDIEVKRRRFKKNTYPTTIINSEKFVELCKRSAILIVMFDDCGGICKNVRKAFVKKTMIFCNHCTDFPSIPEWGSKVELDLNAFNYYDY